jgi:hypothetical protein
MLDVERLDRDEVFENSKEICLRLEWKKRVASVGYDTIVITVHHHQRDRVVVCGSCRMQNQLCYNPTEYFTMIRTRR